ncbi:uncharacterized serine-rich protein C215.13-like [Belonocnema kinseyi]|uniref:uncharacterized serine-rich protein C215.13-like n=1 Tax=Belonocnema kinseyi TaxID=2817044 RepID=UPI00143CCA2A|nr:uncharacterized serine-rich protein C215.13-like [Belonocnema kinseyi]
MGLSSEFDCLPNGEPIFGPNHRRTFPSSSASLEGESPETSSTPVGPSSSALYPEHVEPPVRSRSRSPPASQLSSEFDCLPNGEPIFGPNHRRTFPSSSSSLEGESPETSSTPVGPSSSALYPQHVEPLVRSRSRSPPASRLSSEFDCLPNGEPIFGPTHRRTSPSSSSSLERESPETSSPPVGPSSSALYPEHVEPPVRSRSRSPPASQLSSGFDCLPNGEPISGPSRRRPSSSSSSSSSSSLERESPETSFPPVGPSSSTLSPQHAEPPLRSRSRSPPASQFSSEFDCLPNSEPIFGPRRRPSSSSSSSLERKSPETSFPPVGPSSSAWSPQHAEPPLRSRSKSPPASHTFSRVLGFTLEDIKFVRLIPRNSSTPIFELRRYVFPRDKIIRLKNQRQDLLPMPTGEQIVLSTSNGDVCAIFASSSNNSHYLRALYKPLYKGLKRAKINMHSGIVTELTPEEIAKCAVGTKSGIAKSFEIIRVP